MLAFNVSLVLWATPCFSSGLWAFFVFLYRFFDRLLDVLELLWRCSLGVRCLGGFDRFLDVGDNFGPVLLVAAGG